MMCRPVSTAMRYSALVSRPRPALDTSQIVPPPA